MRITLITSAKDLIEVKRIKEECLRAGHDFSLIDFNKFSYLKKGSELVFYPEIPTSDVVIVRGLFSTIKSLEPLGDYLGYKKAKIFDNNLFAHKYSMNKAYDIMKLVVSGIDTPNTFHSRNYADLRKFTNKMTFPVIVKSAKSGQGKRVWKADTKAEYLKFIKEFEDNEYPAKLLIVQDFVNYKYDLRILVIGEKIFCMRRIPHTGEFRANFSLGGSVELFPLTPKLRKLARKAINAIGLKVAGVDVLIDQEGNFFILEVNHTPGMVGMEKSTGKNITKIYIDYAIKHARQI